MECCMHVFEKDGPVTPFRDAGWKKFITAVFLWKDLGTRESTVAEEAVLRFKLTTQEPAAIPSNCGYHRDCYSNFTNITNIKRAQRRFEKAPLIQEEAEEEVPGVEKEAEDGEGTAAKTRALRSHTSDLCTSQRAPHLLPVQCIICKHDKYIHQLYTRKRVKEKLMQCKTLTAGKLLLAAEGRKDECLLLHIRDRDLVASEARYHFTCFRDYTRYLSKKTKETESNLYENAYKHFCETVIGERILRGREVLRLCRLNMLFKDFVRQREGLTISSYKAHSLKARLQKSHPFLKFQKASTTYFVYVDDLTIHHPV